MPVDLIEQPGRQDTRPEDWLVGGGEMGKLIRSMDWSRTPLGPIESWSQSLRTTVSLCLASNFPIALVWGQNMSRSITMAIGRSAVRSIPTPWVRTSASAGLHRGR